MKPILPSLKEKKRYLVFQASGGKFAKQETYGAVEKACLAFMGELGFGKAGVMMVRDAWKNNRGIIKVNNKHVDDVKVSLGLMKDINKKKAKVEVIGASGILNKAKQKFLEVD